MTTKFFKTYLETETMRNRYRFKSRLEAENAYRDADRRRLHAEWLASALLYGRIKWIGRANKMRVGWFVTRHSAFVVVVTPQQSGSPHSIYGLWDSDEVLNVVNDMMACEVTRDLGVLVDRAKRESWDELFEPAE